MADSTESLAALEAAAREAVDAAADLPALSEARARILGRKGTLSELLRGIGQLPIAERARAGEQANASKARIEAWLEARRSALEARARDHALTAGRLDVTLPGAATPLGRLHPVTRIEREVVSFFAGLGFSVEEGPEVETDFHNFEALNIPADHPARDEHDTFYVGPGRVLRTHTSPVQIRTMTGREPPFRFIAPGRVYRHDISPRHSPMFQQVEGFLVDERTSFAELKGVLYAFAKHIMGATKLRFRASFFPFTEPSAELDFECLLCAGAGCATCSQTGWIEWGGCGMIHPRVLEACGIDPERWQGFAFGMGLERPAMLRHGVPHIRLLYEGDVRVLEQL
ncbi:MAG TPA: phenylalanine--tRNA ligase subunit alpha [Myxococcota bacterium]|jgi:phenylalanyl-tRNA synthetase alpha chain|nr:phenylalanine--tRNA ligase subunit alpha [Myxococcota bacterium]